MYEFLKAAFIEQINIRFESRLCVDILMHERIEHERKTELYGSQSFEISIPHCVADESRDCKKLRILSVDGCQYRMLLGFQGSRGSRRIKK